MPVLSSSFAARRGCESPGATIAVIDRRYSRRVFSFVTGSYRSHNRYPSSAAAAVAVKIRTRRQSLAKKIFI
jgi:hypothetical protein